MQLLIYCIFFSSSFYYLVIYYFLIMLAGMCLQHFTYTPYASLCTCFFVRFEFGTHRAVIARAQDPHLPFEGE